MRNNTADLRAVYIKRSLKRNEYKNKKEFGNKKNGGKAMIHATPGRGRQGILFLLFLLCFSTIAFTASTPLQILKVQSFDDQTKTRVIFESNEPLVYSAYTTPENPEEIIIDFPDATLVGVDKVVNIFSREVKTLAFSDVPLQDNAFITRTKISLTAEMSYHISQHRNYLYIDILPIPAGKEATRILTNNDINAFNSQRQNKLEKTSLNHGSDSKLDITELEPETPRYEPQKSSKTEVPSINMPVILKDITYDIDGDNLSINLVHTGQPEFSTFELQSPDRLIVDLHKAKNSVYPKQVNIDTYNVKRIRTAQFQSDPVKIARVVLDITKPINYKILKANGAIKIVVGTDDYIASIENSFKPAAEMNSVPETEDERTASLVPDISSITPPVDQDNEPAKENSVTVNLGLENGQLVEIKDENEVIPEEKGEVDVKLFETANTLGGDVTDVGFNTPQLSTDQQKQAVTDSQFGAKIISEGKKYVGEEIGLRFKEADIKDIIQILGDVTGKNFIVDEKVRGKVTINFNSVPWDQALDIILSLNDLGMEKQDNIIIIAPHKKLEDKAKKERALQEERELAGPTDFVAHRVSYAKAESVAEIIKTYLTKRGQVVVDKRTNLLLIKELQTNMDSIIDLVNQLDIPTRQVNIEARIIETTRNYEKDLGIQWGWLASADDEYGNATRYLFPHSITVAGATSDAAESGVPYAVNLPGGAPSSAISLSMGNVLGSLQFDMTLDAMEEDGKARILASPSISTQNNIEATIYSGTRIPFTSVVDNTASIQFIEAKLELKVTPQITSDNTIIMEVIVEKSEPDYSIQITNVQGSMPIMLTKKAEATMLVKDGGTAVIGGILQINDSEAERRVPFFYKIPIIGSLFKANNWSRSDSEMLIFVTPKILGFS
ncbi:MAG: type IV pilus secretin PilQ [Acidobacteria bacterium]|nr:type IV pilus secretin PilQ [Acidobacteriota bacterium]